MPKTQSIQLSRFEVDSPLQRPNVHQFMTFVIEFLHPSFIPKRGLTDFPRGCAACESCISFLYIARRPPGRRRTFASTVESRSRSNPILPARSRRSITRLIQTTRIWSFRCRCTNPLEAIGGGALRQSTFCNPTASLEASPSSS